MISFKVSGTAPESVPARSGEGVSCTQVFSNPPALKGAKRLSTLLGSDWLGNIALAGLAIFVSQIVVWNLPA